MNILQETEIDKSDLRINQSFYWNQTTELLIEGDSKINFEVRRRIRQGYDRTLNLKLRQKLAQCYIYLVLLYGIEAATLNKK